MSDITLNAFLSKMRVKNLTKKGGRICMKIRNGPLKKILKKHENGNYSEFIFELLARKLENCY